MTTDRHRETATRHAQILEDQKRIRSQVIDLIIECYDLPSQPDVQPSDPRPPDAKLFNKALSLFQPSDFDELVSERNIDDRCGYALCPNPNQKARHGGTKIWNRKGGKNFKMVDRVDVEKWCSPSCKARGDFVKGQLSSEPAWLRDVTETQVKLLDDMQRADDLSAAIKDLTIDEATKDDLEAKLKLLSLERGDAGHDRISSNDVVENEVNEVPEPPVPPSGNHPDARRVRFGDA
jgi:RNA polymerase II-associated protein 2